jgi:hypothetical protein
MRNKLLLTFISFLSLTACEPQSNLGSDGYRFGEKQYEQSSVQVNVVTYKTREKLVASAKKLGVNNEDIAAFAILQKNGKICTMHIIDPEVSYEPEFIGHEFAHCVYGQWHHNNNSRS